ncbi:bifunctional hydroxymethylpyrimidine kinase/phosphomethylpyrimidine kinase [Bacillus sp. 31A1R]|uniref:Hydroxymethylpyrimidine/phosphomethylpyrimidine kinase n=1 Tax=Robertmurraya mangrovi TaxID=3098077 RepID=A0ABU5J3G7_9BACI|nr:bifunctional hydroxymethylpyrimidine kinase/phosphomethylpyrimidine kinase [Bacillus sp. 31A1R]MDZ5473905.1 bifunctional hydroxymethylpyrimidine kinase/phosphomethylpyrimidine kinase [Bacillus sp. 31A1R]
MRKVLTIAGSDSGGGAGIQADIKTFQELEVFGMSAITAITAQNTLGVQAVFPLTPDAVAEQMDSIGTDMGTDAIKTGMLFNGEIIQAVSGKIKQYGWTNVVVDPVMIAKGGASLLKLDAISALKKYLLPISTIVTPNIPEAEELTSMKIESLEDKKEAARRLIDLGVKNAVIKGGHDTDPLKSNDLLYDGVNFIIFESDRIQTKNTHGTGCTFSAAIAAELSKGIQIEKAVKTAKDFIQAAIEDQLYIGLGHGPTNHGAYRKSLRETRI